LNLIHFLADEGSRAAPPSCPAMTRRVLLL